MGFELTVKVVLKKDMHFTESLQEIGNLLSESFLKDSGLKALHASKGYKNYVFDNLSSTERGGVYKKGKVYSFRVRSVSRDFIGRLSSVVSAFENKSFRVINVRTNIFSDIDNGLLLEKLVTKNPIIFTGDDIIVDDFDYDTFVALVESNIEKKYNDFFGTSISNHRWIRGVTVVSRKPIGLKYKGIKLLGKHYEILINSDVLSQEFAEFASFVGIGEKNSVLGAGFAKLVAYEVI